MNTSIDHGAKQKERSARLVRRMVCVTRVSLTQIIVITRAKDKKTFQTNNPAFCYNCHSISNEIQWEIFLSYANSRLHVKMYKISTVPCLWMRILYACLEFRAVVIGVLIEEIRPLWFDEIPANLYIGVRCWDGYLLAFIFEPTATW